MSDWSWIGLGLALDWYYIAVRLRLDWCSIDVGFVGFAYDWRSIGIEFILGWICVKVLIKRRMINKKSDDAPPWKKNSARVRRSLHFKISG